MKYNELQTAKSRSRTRVGRGIAAGKGKTAGRGTKGQGSRKSGGVRPGFEGGQIPLYMRLPKLRGFKSHQTPVSIIYTSELNKLKPAIIDNAVLAEAGLINNPYVVVKVLQKGELSLKKEVKLQAASAGAQKAIEAVGGSFNKVERLPRPSVKTKNEK